MIRKAKLTPWLLSVLLAVGLFFAVVSLVRATRPIDGQTISFGSGSAVGVSGTDVRALALGDLDLDGSLDLISGAGNATAGHITAWRNDGTPLNGTWSSTSTPGTTDSRVNAVAVGDLDNDGHLDILSGDGTGTGGNVIIWHNPLTDTNHFATSDWLSNTLGTVADAVYAVALGDLDNDGNLDVAVGRGTATGGAVIIWQNPFTPTSSFSDTSWATTHTVATTADAVYALSLADLDGDGRLDIAAGTGSNEDAEIITWRNDGSPFDGGWSAQDVGASDDAVYGLAVGDLDNDGALDVIASSGSGEDYEIVAWASDGSPFDGGWTTHDVGASLDDVRALIAADLDHDGDLDLATASAPGEDNEIVAWQNDGTPFDGLWSSVDIGAAGDVAYALITGDVDNDGDADLLSGGGSAATNEILAWANTLIHHNMPFSSAANAAGTNADDINALVLADLDGDGDEDMVTGAGADASNNLMAWQNNGTPFSGSWASSAIGDVAGNIYAVAVGDLDNDARPDVVSGATQSPYLRVWQNDGTPFAGTWSNYTLSNPLTAVDAVVLGDLDNDGDLDLVVGTGPHYVYNVSDNYRILVYENDGTPFDGSWGGASTVRIISRTVHALALGDLDNDGWLDIVAGVHRYEPVGSSSDPVDPEYWPDWYELRAYRNDGTPFNNEWAETNVGRDPETVTLQEHYHGFWGDSVWDVALADLDKDGDLDIATADGIGADYQIKVWENDGTPFDGQPQAQHWTWQPTAVFVGSGAPWMNGTAWDVATTDVNADGQIDLVTGSAWGEYYEVIAWENDGRPFGTTITDTTWIRHNIGSANNTHAYAIGVADLDNDGDFDVASGHSWQTRNWDPALYHLATWENQCGSVTEVATSLASPQEDEGSTADLMSVAVTNNGLATDNDAELNEWQVHFEASTGVALTSTMANNLIENLYVYRDADDDGQWHPVTDTRVFTLTSLALDTSGIQTISLADGDENVRVPAANTVSFFIVAEFTSDASSQFPNNTFILTFDPDADSIVEDRAEDTSLSIQDTLPVSTGLVTLIGPPTQVIIEDQPTSSGVEVMTATLGSGASLTVYANSHDALGNFCDNVAVAWALTDMVGNVDSADLVPSGDNRSATFTADRIGAARIQADDLTLTDDTTGLITVTLEIEASPTPAKIGDTGGTVVLATLVDDDLTSVPDGTVVTLTTNLGSFDGQATVNRTTAGGVVTATLASADLGTATVTVTGNTSQGWIDVDFVVGHPYTVTVDALPTTIAIGGAATSTVTATVVDQYGHWVADGTVVTFTTNLGSFPTTPYARTTVSGVVTATLTAGNTSGQAIVTADAGTDEGQTTVEFTAGEPATVTVAANPASIVADGVSTSAITAIVTDQWSNPVTDGTVVTFTTNLGSFPTTPYTTMTVDGAATATLTAGTDLGTATVTVSATHAFSSTAVQFVPGKPYTVTVEADPTSVVADGVSTSTITATVTDQQSRPVADGTVVTFTTSLGSLPASPYIATTSNGVATAVLTVGTSTGQAIVTADAGTAQGQTTVQFRPGALAYFDLSGYPLLVTSGSSFSGVVVTARDANGNVKTDYTGAVYFTSTDIQASLPFTVGNTFSFTVGDAGQHSFAESFVLRTTGIQHITVTDGSISQASDDITVGSGTATTIQIEDAADGSGDVVGARDLVAGSSLTVYAVARDEVGNFVENATVAWSLTAKSGGVADGDLTPSGDGRSATFTGGLAGTARIRAQHTTLGSDETGVISVTPGPLASFELVAPDSGIAGQPFTLTITARDACGNVLTSFAEDVSLSADSGTINPTVASAADFVAGVWTGPVTLSEAGAGRVITVSFGGVSNQITIDLASPDAQPYKIFLPVVLRNH